MTKIVINVKLWWLSPLYSPSLSRLADKTLIKTVTSTKQQTETNTYSPWHGIICFLTCRITSAEQNIGPTEKFKKHHKSTSNRSLKVLILTQSPNWICAWRCQSGSALEICAGFNLDLRLKMSIWICAWMKVPIWICLMLSIWICALRYQSGSLHNDVNLDLRFKIPIWIFSWWCQSGFALEGARYMYMKLESNICYSDSQNTNVDFVQLELGSYTHAARAYDLTLTQHIIQIQIGVSTQIRVL